MHVETFCSFVASSRQVKPTYTVLLGWTERMVERTIRALETQQRNRTRWKTGTFSKISLYTIVGHKYMFRSLLRQKSAAFILWTESTV